MVRDAGLKYWRLTEKPAMTSVTIWRDSNQLDKQHRYTRARFRSNNTLDAGHQDLTWVMKILAGGRLNTSAVWRPKSLVRNWIQAALSC